MKKLNLKSLNLGASDLLNRQELKTVFGGYTDNDCKIFIRTRSGANYWSGRSYSVSKAQEYYDTNGDWLVGGYRVTGYCCANC